MSRCKRKRRRHRVITLRPGERITIRCARRRRRRRRRQENRRCHCGCAR